VLKSFPPSKINDFQPISVPTFGSSLEITFPMFPNMVIGSHDFPAFSGWKPCFSADHKQFLADHWSAVI
jgi:hypothetical protein